MAFEDISKSAEYVVREIQKIRAAITVGDIYSSLKMLAALKASPQLGYVYDLNMIAGKGLTFGGAVSFAESFLRANNQVQALSALAGNRPESEVPRDSPERALFDSAFFDASQGDFKKAKDSLAGVSTGSGKMILINNQRFTLDQALAFCLQALDAVKQSQEARRALSWLDYVKKQL